MVDGAAGKGDRYRKVDPKKYRENYEAIFGKKKPDGPKQNKIGKKKHTKGRLGGPRRK